MISDTISKHVEMCLLSETLFSIYSYWEPFPGDIVVPLHCSPKTMMIADFSHKQ